MAIEQQGSGPFDVGIDNEIVDANSGPASETLSMSLLGGKEVKPGDVVRIRVEAVNEEDGTWQGAYADEDVGEDISINQMASAMDAPPAGVI